MFKVINDGKLPIKATKYSACVDLCANADFVIGAGETVLVPLGVCIDLDLMRKASDLELINLIGYDNAMANNNSDIALELFMLHNYLQLMLRSSLSKELIIANGVGIIDLDYKDEIMIRLHNPFTKNSILHTISSFIEKGISLFGYEQNYEIQENVLLTQKRNGYLIQKGDKIAQIMLCEHKSYLFGIESEEERVGGFGSTGN